MSDQPSRNAIVQRLQVLFSGAGYDFYNNANKARADDQLVRERASASLTAASHLLAGVEAEYKRHFIPPATRENPYPPADVMEGLRSIGRVRTRIGSIDALVRGMSVPTQDKTWWRFRSEPAMLDLLLTYDVNLVIDSERVETAAKAATAAAFRDTPAQDLFEEVLGELEKAIEQRAELLMKPI